MDFSAELFNNWAFVLAQIIGIVNTVIAIISCQFKQIKVILMGEILTNLFCALQFALLGGISGAWICIVGTVASVLMFAFDQYQQKHEVKNAEKKRSIMMASFGLVFVVGTIITYRSWEDIVSLVGALTFVLSVTRKTSRWMRNYSLANCALWTVYDIATMAYTSVLTHGSIIVSLLIAKARLDWKKEKAEASAK